MRVHRDELAARGAGVEALQPHRFVRQHGTRDDLAGQLGGDRSVSVDVCWFVAGAEECGVAHHQAKRDAGAGGETCGTEDGTHQGVGHRLTPGPRVAAGLGRVSGPRQGGVDADAVLDRQQSGQPRHGVRCGPQTDVAVGLGATTPRHIRLRVEPVGLLLAQRRERPLAQPLEAVAVTCHHVIQGGAVVSSEAGGLPGDQRGFPLRDAPFAPGRPCVRQLGRDDPGQSEVPLTSVRRLASRERDLRGHPAALLRRGDAAVGLDGTLRPVELDGHRRWGRRGRAGQLLERPDQVDATGVIESVGRAHGFTQRGSPTGHGFRECHCIEHTFECYPARPTLATGDAGPVDGLFLSLPRPPKPHRARPPGPRRGGRGRGTTRRPHDEGTSPRLRP